MALRSPATIVKPGGIFGPGAPAPELPELSLRELAESGLIYEINRKVLWDLGLALAVERDNADPQRYTRLFVIDTQPLTRWTLDGPDDELWATFQRWASQRVGQVRE